MPRFPAPLRKAPINAARAALPLFCLTLLASTSTHAQLVYSSAGPTAGDIQGTVDAFRVDLGANNLNAAGPLPGGRREINWDGGGSAVTVSPTPFNGFRAIRGASFTTPGTGFEQSPGFGDVNATYLTTFATFSPLRLFAPLGSNIMDATFVVPGTLTPASVRAFGAVFTDVDLANTTSIEYFDLSNVSLGTFFVPNVFAANGTFSFLGVSYADPIISRVRITTGTTALGPDDNPGGGVDVVAMDDFIYAEPQAIAVPEPGTMLLAAAGLLPLAALRRRRRA